MILIHLKTLMNNRLFKLNGSNFFTRVKSRYLNNSSYKSIGKKEYLARNDLFNKRSRKLGTY
jgi:hypothetical protein